MRDDLVPALEEYLARVAESEFDYRNMDCIRFVAGWVAIATGIDHLIGLTWTSEDEGRALLAGLGAAGLPDAVSLYMPSIPVVRADMGDIVAFPGLETDPGWTPMGICTGQYSVFMIQDRGLSRVRTLSASHAWNIGL